MTTFIVSVDYKTCDQSYQQYDTVLMLGSHLNAMATCEGNIVTACYDMYTWTISFKDALLKSLFYKSHDDCLWITCCSILHAMCKTLNLKEPLAMTISLNYLIAKEAN